MPCACATVRASVARRISTRLSSTVRAFLESRSARSSPSRSSITRKDRPSAVSPCATYRTIPGCDRSESSRASRRNRSAAPSVTRSRTFNATGSPPSRSAARNTEPIPPLPMGCSMTNRSATTSPTHMDGEDRSSPEERPAGVPIAAPWLRSGIRGGPRACPNGGRLGAGDCSGTRTLRSGRARFPASREWHGFCCSGQQTRSDDDHDHPVATPAEVERRRPLGPAHEVSAQVGPAPARVAWCAGTGESDRGGSRNFEHRVENRSRTCPSAHVERSRGSGLGARESRRGVTADLLRETVSQRGCVIEGAAPQESSEETQCKNT